MALNAHVVKKLVKLVKPGDMIASLGYPDILYEPDGLKALLGDRIERLEYREDSQEICSRHGVMMHPVPDADSFFGVLGAALVSFDVTQERGRELILDLNHPLPEKYAGAFDFVLDVGTLEHCFNAGQALVNIASLAKVGGTVFHENPFNWGNHGFWGVNPTLFHDFYTANGFDVVDCYLAEPMSERAWKPPITGRFNFTECEANVVTRARRNEIKPLVFPTQTKYSKGAS